MSSLATPESLFGKPPARRYVSRKIEGFEHYGEFRLQTLNALEAAEFDNEKWNANGKINREAFRTTECRLIVRMWVDENGNRRMTADEIPKLMELESAFINRLFEACLEHNNPKSVEDAEKNSGATQA